MKNNKWVTKETDALFNAILSIKDVKEARKFFRDLLTEPELAEFANRWKVAQMLSKGVSYTTIEKETGMSTTTIARISKWLNSGMDGYNLILSRVSHHSPSRLREG